MKKYLFSLAFLFSLSFAAAQKDTVRVSNREYMVNKTNYTVIFANGQPFVGDRTEFLKRIFHSSIQQPEDENIVIYPCPSDTLKPYRIAIRNPLKFWEIALWAPYQPRLEKYASAGIIFTYKETGDIYRLMHTIKGNYRGLYSRWYPSVTTDQTDY